MDTTHFDLISIIIPVYNTEKYLPQCLDSLIAQNHDNIEIICVNDASTDNSSTILHQYAQKDKRILVFDLSRNHGVGYVRNFAIEKAHGEYIGFVDSDDWACPNMFDTLLAQTKIFDADISFCNFYKSDSNNSSTKNTFNPLPWEKELFPQGFPFLWQCLIKKSFFTESQLSFPSLATGEDLAVIIPLFMYSHKIAHTDEALYHHRIDNPSITRKQNATYFGETIIGIESAIANIKNLNIWNQENQNIMNNLLIHVYLFSFFDIFVRFTSPPTQYLPELQQSLKKKFPSYRKTPAWKLRNLKQKFLLSLLIERGNIGMHTYNILRNIKKHFSVSKNKRYPL